MPESASASNHLLQVAVLHYKHGHRQQDIAKELGISPMAVSRALKRAREQGIVKVTLDLPIKTSESLEHELASRFALRDAFVVDQDHGESGDALLGRGGALYLKLAMLKDDVLGVALGRTVSSLVPHIEPAGVSGVEAVQLLGNLQSNSSFNAANLLQEMCARFQIPGLYLNAPVYLAKEANQEQMRGWLTERVWPLWRRCSLALLGIGEVGNHSVFFGHEIDESEMAELVRLGAVGDVLGQFFDIDGRFIDHERNARAVAIPRSLLSQTSRVVAVTSGPQKARALVGALRTGLINCLVTTSATASAVLDIHDS